MNNELKLKIAIDLAGLKEDYRKSHNPSDTIQPVYHYIEDVLKKHNISFNEARNILLDMQGAFSPKMNNNVIKFIINYCKIKEGSFKQSKPKEVKLPTSFNWKGMPEQLDELYRQLIEIEPRIETTPDTFKMAFSKDLKVFNQPIKWNETIRLLAYFFDNLYREQLIGSNKWQSIIERYKLFINRDNKPVTANDLSVAKSEYNSYGLQKGKEKINKLLKEVKNIKNIKNS